MPANRKYLASPGQRALKITAAIFGGYLVAASVHILIASIKPIHEIVVLTSGFTFFLLWAVLMVLAFLSRNGWRVWGIYMVITLFFAGLLFLIK